MTKLEKPTTTVLVVDFILYLDPREDAGGGYVEVDESNHFGRGHFVVGLQLLLGHVVQFDEGRDGLGVQQGSRLLWWGEG